MQYFIHKMRGFRNSPVDPKQKPLPAIVEGARLLKGATPPLEHILFLQLINSVGPTEWVNS